MYIKNKEVKSKLITNKDKETDADVYNNGSCYPRYSYYDVYYKTDKVMIAYNMYDIAKEKVYNVYINNNGSWDFYNSYMSIIDALKIYNKVNELNNMY